MKAPPETGSLPSPAGRVSPAGELLHQSPLGPVKYAQPALLAIMHWRLMQARTSEQPKTSPRFCFDGELPREWLYRTKPEAPPLRITRTVRKTRK